MLDIVLEKLQEVDFEGFEPSEVHGITTYYVCSYCYSPLVAYNIPNDRLYIVICSNCAVNVEQIGAVSKNTVSIRMEQARREYREVIENLKDLYPDLQPVRQSIEENLKDLGF